MNNNLIPQQHNPGKKWLIAEPISKQASAELEIYSPIIRQIVYNRGYTSLKEALNFIDAKPPNGSDPLNMLGIPEAIPLSAMPSVKSSRLLYMAIMMLMV